MFIIWGTKVFRKVIGKSSYVNECQHCHNEVTYEISSVWRWFTIFWIPLFPISRKKYFLACPICGYGYDITKEQAESVLVNPYIDMEKSSEENEQV